MMQAEILPLQCWPIDELLKFRDSIAAALKANRLRNHDLLVALDWSDAIDGELEARQNLPTLEQACGLVTARCSE